MRLLTVRVNVSSPPEELLAHFQELWLSLVGMEVVDSLSGNLMGQNTS